MFVWNNSSLGNKKLIEAGGFAYDIAEEKLVDVVSKKQDVLHVIIVLAFLAPIGYGLYEVGISQNKQYAEKKNNYEYVIEFLEDYLF